MITSFLFIIVFLFNLPVFLSNINFQYNTKTTEDNYYNYLLKHYEEKLNNYNKNDFFKNDEDNDLEYIVTFKDEKNKGFYNVYVYCKKENIIIYYPVFIDSNKARVISAESFIFDKFLLISNSNEKTQVMDLLIKINTLSNHGFTVTEQKEELERQLNAYYRQRQTIIF